MRYKIGDKVRVKNDLRVCKEAKEFLGKIVTIVENSFGTNYKIKEDGGEWDWADEMFEPATQLFDTGAVRDVKDGKGRLDLLPPRALLRLSRHFEKGAKTYGERNWEKGIPIHSFIDSGMRHVLRYLAGETDEDHLCAAAWNLMCAMETEETMPEMQDIPSRMEVKKDEA